MGRVRVVTDSATDLPAEMVSALEITVVPLVVRFGERTYLDGELTIDEFWELAVQGPHHPATSQPSIDAFEEPFANLVEQGYDVLCVTITGQHSGTYSTACVAARRFEGRVHVHDSQSLSLGQGFQVLAAAQAAREGMRLEHVIQLVEGVRARTQVIILLDSIEYIRRGGRADRLMPVIGRVANILRVKPLLYLDEGRLSLKRLVRSHEGGLARIEAEVQASGVERAGWSTLRLYTCGLYCARARSRAGSQRCWGARQTRSR